MPAVINERRVPQHLLNTNTRRRVLPYNRMIIPTNTHLGITQVRLPTFNQVVRATRRITFLLIFTSRRRSFSSNTPINHRLQFRAISFIMPYLPRFFQLHFMSTQRSSILMVKPIRSKSPPIIQRLTFSTPRVIVIRFFTFQHTRPIVIRTRQITLARRVSCSTTFT